MVFERTVAIKATNTASANEIRPTSPISERGLAVWGKLCALSLAAADFTIYTELMPLPDSCRFGALQAADALVKPGRGARLAMDESPCNDVHA
jgi:hypothetical protein